MEEKSMDKTITLAHGAGGKQTAELIDQVFKAHFANPDFTGDDAAVLPRPDGKIAFTTDGFIVSPYEFPGGNIGKLSICGTVNDLSCMGAKPKYLSCSFVIEEGFPIDKLEMIASSMEKTAKEAGVRIVAGDTKVAGKGQVDHIFITTTGIGEVLPGIHTSGTLARPGDSVIVTGDIGRHGAAILLARGEFGIDADISSDCAPLWGTVSRMLDASKNIHVIRDATRGGVGTVLYEIAGQSHVGIHLDAQSVPVSGPVSGVCGMLGLEPLYLACEGTLVVFIPKSDVSKILDALHDSPYATHATVIGEVVDDMPGSVVMRTAIGSETLLPQPGGELLPRIC
jgi:hydrogenase expression/formation protein HypE